MSQENAGNDLGGSPKADGIEITWVEKYVTYEQSADGVLRVTDHHFLAEVCYRDRAQLRGRNATLYADGPGTVLATYTSDDPWTFTNGYHYTRKSKSYDTLSELEAAHPAAGNYTWLLDGPAGQQRLPAMRIGGPESRTAIPDPSPILLSQLGRPVADVMAVVPDEPLTVSWRPFSNGVAREGSLWQDLIFVLISNARGEVVYTGGAPGAADGFLDYTRTSTIVPAGTLVAGTDYVAFISCVKYVDCMEYAGIQQLACNSFAVELPIRTAGVVQTVATARRRATYLWAGKTPRQLGMVPWPGFVTVPST